MAPGMQRLDTNERIGRLETSVEGLHDELTNQRRMLQAIADKVSSGRETNWSVVIGGLAVMGSLYAAAIRPLEKEQTRVDAAAKTLAAAIVVQDESIAKVRTATAVRLALLEHGITEQGAEP